MELGQLFQTFQDSVVVACSKSGVFFLDIFTLEDETPTRAQNFGNCLPDLTVSYPRKIEPFGRPQREPENLRVPHIFNAIKNSMNKINAFNSYL